MLQITQIAAKETKCGKSFNCYIKPNIPISPEATTVTGIPCINISCGPKVSWFFQFRSRKQFFSCYHGYSSFKIL
jgi:hypothetical protein